MFASAAGFETVFCGADRRDLEVELTPSDLVRLTAARSHRSLGDHVGHLLEPLDGQARGELHPIAFQQVKAMEPAHPA